MVISDVTPCSLIDTSVSEEPTAFVVSLEE
jgi:hypothetical protein